MKILLKLFSKKYGTVDDQWYKISENDRLDISNLLKRIMLYAEESSIIIWHSGKNYRFEDGIEEVINFPNLSINWGGFGSRININNLYDYFKYEYSGDLVTDNKLKSKVTAARNLFRGVTAYFEDGVSKETIEKFISLDGSRVNEATGEICLKVINGSEPMIEKGYKDINEYPFFIISESSLK